MSDPPDRARSPLSSPKNPRIRAAIRLRKRIERKRTGRTLIEGVRELACALDAGAGLETLFFCDELLGAEGLDLLAPAESSGAQLVSVDRRAFNALAVCADHGGLLAVGPIPTQSLTEVPLGEPPLLVVLDGVEKPGNVGAVLRVADAAGADGLLLSGAGTDVYNPNVIRASLGTVFSVPTVEAKGERVREWLRQREVGIVVASPGAERSHFDTDLQSAVALVFGSEHAGVSERWRDSADALLGIPMSGAADSLNISTAVAVVLYETVRQRATAPDRFPP